MPHLLERQLPTADGLRTPMSWNPPEEWSTYNPALFWWTTGRTVFSANIPMTLSHSVPLFGCHPNSLDRARARCPTLSAISTAVYVLPEMPHVKGFFDCLRGHLPWVSSSMNWLTGTVSGGSRLAACQQLSPILSVTPQWCSARANWVQLPKGSFGTHAGGVKTITRFNSEVERLSRGTLEQATTTAAVFVCPGQLRDGKLNTLRGLQLNFAGEEKRRKGALRP
jgi:hypothetical protein